MPILIEHGLRNGIDQLVESEPVARLHIPTPRTLGKLVPQALHRELHIGHSPCLTGLPRIQLYSPISPGTGARPEATHVPHIKFFILPRKYPFGNFLAT